MPEGHDIISHGVTAREVFAKTVTDIINPHANGATHRFIFKDGMFVDVIGGVKPSFGRVGKAYSLRNGKLECADEDFPSYDGQGIRIRGECDQYMWATDHPETFSIINGSGRELSPDDGIDGGNAGRCTPDNDAGSWQFNRSVSSATAFAQGNNWCFSIYIKAATAEDVGKEIRLTMQEGNGVDLVTTNSDDFVLTVGWVRHEMYIPITLAATNRIACVLNRAGSDLNRAELYDICCPMLNKGTKARDFIHNPGADGSFATRSTEAADDAGNGLRILLPDDIKAALGGKVTRERLGPEINPDPEFQDPSAWATTENGTISAGFFVQGAHADNDNAVSDAIAAEAGHAYRITWKVSAGESARTRISIGGDWTGAYIGVGIFSDTIVYSGSVTPKIYAQFMTDSEGAMDWVHIEEVLTDVLTPTGPDVFPHDVAWASLDGTTEIAIDNDTFEFINAGGWNNLRKPLGAVEINAVYIIKGFARGVSGKIALKGLSGDGLRIDIENDGPFCGLFQNIDDTAFYCMAASSLYDVNGVVTITSMEKITPSATIYLKWIPGIDPTPGLGTQGLLNLVNSTSNRGFFYNDGSGRVQCGDGSQYPSSGIDYVGGEESLTAMIFDGDNFRLYTDGIVGSDKPYSVVNAQEWESLYAHVGNTDYDDTFVEVGLANYAMTAEELANV